MHAGSADPAAFGGRVDGQHAEAGVALRFRPTLPLVVAGEHEGDGADHLAVQFRHQERRAAVDALQRVGEMVAVGAVDPPVPVVAGQRQPSDPGGVGPAQRPDPHQLARRDVVGVGQRGHGVTGYGR
jgi:hypothetical protein